MKEKIIQYLMEHPESRKRTIAAHLNIWQCDTQFLAAMCELQQEGQIKSTYHRIPENMEFYDTFSVIGA
jgi:hypothetical protein